MIVADTEISITLHVTPIGEVSLGIDGHDEYLLVECRMSELTDEMIENWFVHYRYRGGSDVPGRYFCHTWTRYPYPYGNWKAVLVVHHRFDV